MSLCLLGIIVGVHGIRGWLKAEIYSDTEDRLSLLDSILVGPSELKATRMEIEDSREESRPVLLKLAQVDDRNEAQLLTGMKMYITDDQMLPPPEGKHYVHELIGCTVVDAETEEVYGTVRDILALPNYDVYAVQTKTGEVLIPSVPDFVRNVDMATRRISVTPIPGMFTKSDDEN